MAPAALDAQMGLAYRLPAGRGHPCRSAWVDKARPAGDPARAPDATAKVSSARTGLGVARENRRIIVLALIVLASGTISTYVFNYMATFAQHTLHMSPTVALLGNADRL